MDDKLIPVEVVLQDMESDSGMVASGARDYFLHHYVSAEDYEQTKAKFDKQDRQQGIVALLFLLSPVILFAVLCLTKGV